jgi:hypothetical protein
MLPEGGDVVTLPRPVRLERAFEDPDAVRGLVERSGPFSSIASYLPPAATGVRDAGDEVTDVMPWFRSNWAVNGRSQSFGADTILHNPRFIDAACRFLDVEAVTPSTVVINVNAPMRAGAIHIDIPSFRGAGRDRYPLPLLQAMGTCGLFEPWRIIEVGAVTWFYTGAGGAYDYWPDGLDAPMASERPPFDGIALFADNDRMYHRIGWIGDEAAPSPPITAAATIDHDADCWIVTDGGRSVVTYRDADVRISILWKARAKVEPSDGPAPLSPERIVEIFSTDLHARGLPWHHNGPLLCDARWLQHIHDIYYRDPTPTSTS